MASSSGESSIEPGRPHGRVWWRGLGVWERRPRAASLAYPVLLALGTVDAAGYSVIGPVLPALATRHHAGVALMGAVAAAFPWR
jgi:hypothetical protein